jgi:hypothetical protein
MINKKLKILIILGILFIGIQAVFYFPIFMSKGKKDVLKPKKFDPQMEVMLGNEVVAYGILRHYSNAGVMTFEYYDIEKGEILNNKNKPWFWANPDTNNKEKTSNFISLIDDNRDSVFKITGRRREDSCKFEKGVCLEDIEVDEVSIAGKANIPEKKNDIDYSKYEGGPNDETKKITQDGYIDGFYDATDLNRTIKQGYVEPDLQDFLKNLYFYGYLLGYDGGCEQVNLVSEDCKNIPKLLEELFWSSEQNEDIYTDPSIGTII